MKYDPEKHHRRSIRLRGYNYTQPGAYFVTLVTQDRMPLFGKIIDGRMQLSRFGNIVDMIWRRLPHHFRHIRLDEYVVMPNHFHGIIWIVRDKTGNKTVGARHSQDETCIGIPHNYCHLQNPQNFPGNASPQRPTGAPSGSLGALIGNFKSISTRRINGIRRTPGARVWQRNYYERIIRDQQELNAIRQYIIDNPRQWLQDREFGK